MISLLTVPLLVSALHIHPIDFADVMELKHQSSPSIIQEQEGYLDEDVSLYMAFTDEELELLFRTVEAEATDYDVECKSHVASVIFNRMKAGWHDGDLVKNIMAKNQFSVISSGRYLRMTITEETIEACEIAFTQDTAQGALYFDSTNGKSWASRNKKWIFKDDVHDFYSGEDK